jgi:hypothetical protein
MCNHCQHFEARAGRHQADMSYCRCSRSRLRSRGFENKTERPGHRAYSAGIAYQTVVKRERRGRLQPHVKKLLGPKEISRCEERHIRASLGIRRERSKIAKIILSRSTINDVLTELNGGPSGGHLGVNRALNKVQ